MDRRLLFSALFCLLAVVGRTPAAQPEPVEGELFDQTDDANQPPAPQRSPNQGKNGAKAPPIIYDGTGDASGDILMDADGGGYPSGCGADGCMDGGCGDCCDGCCGGCCDSCCGDCCCGSCGCGWYGRADALGFWVRGQTLPPLLTTSPPGTPQSGAGVLPNADVLVPQERVNGDGRVGGRFSIGRYGDCCTGCGFEANFLVLENQSQSFSASSSGTPILARPFFNTLTAAPDAVLVAFPGVVAGSISGRTSNSVLGAEANFRHRVWDCGCKNLDFIGGYRFFRFDEDLQLDTSSTITDPFGNIPLGTTISVDDLIGTENQFHGGQLGMILQRCCGRWNLDLLAKCALGRMNQRAVLRGNTAIVVPGGPSITREGGFLALPSNSGEFEQNRFTAIPEFGINLGCQLNCRWKFNVGYTFIYVPNVLRPGNLIDLNIDPRQFPPSTSAGTQPTFAFNDTDMWLQGINLGLECKF